MKTSKTFTRIAITVTAIATASALVVGCSTEGGQGTETAQEQSVNSFGIDSPTLAAESDPRGIEALKRFFPEAESAVIAGANRSDREAAARAGVEEGVPVVFADGDATALAEALKSAGVESVEAYGEDVQSLELDGIEVNAAQPVEAEDSSQESEAVEQEAVEAEASQDSPSQDDAAAQSEAESETIASLQELETPHAEDVDLTVFTAPGTDLAAAATARAAGATVMYLPVADPRATSESMEAAEKGAYLAMGEGFGPQENFDAAASMVDAGELPGGGGLVFPGRRMIALYGHPSGPALGMMGEQPAEEAVARVQEYVDQYQQFEEQPVIPAFEIIATIASDSPGADGDYSNETAPEELVSYVDAITEAGGYAFLDLQPGRARLVDQAKIYEDLLKRPNVGLALDPEWKIGPDEVPMTNIGHVQADEVNEVADWLAQLVRDNNLPQKGLILHQFQLQMIRDRETIKTDHPELSFILHADGHGGAEQKFDTWNVMRQDLDPNWFMAWKNFWDEDTPMFTPEQTYDVDPRPWFVSYQ